MPPRARSWKRGSTRWRTTTTSWRRRCAWCRPGRRAGRGVRARCRRSRCPRSGATAGSPGVDAHAPRATREPGGARMQWTRNVGRALTAATLGAVLAMACAQRAAPRDSRVTPPRSSAAGEVAPMPAGRVARVALATGASLPVFGGTGEWRVFAEDARSPLARASAGPEWRVERRGLQLRAVGPDVATPWRDGPLVARATTPDGYLTFNGRRWRGELWAHATNTGVAVVNRVAVEDYLRGVVPLELDAPAPADAAALQAQAVAARSYVYSRLPEFEPRDVAIRQAALPYDLRATTSDQVYG